MFLYFHAAIGLVVHLFTHNDEVLISMPMLCTREFSCDAEGFHVEEEKGVYHELVHKKGIPTEGLASDK